MPNAFAICIFNHQLRFGRLLDWQFSARHVEDHQGHAGVPIEGIPDALDETYWRLKRQCDMLRGGWMAGVMGGFGAQ